MGGKGDVPEILDRGGNDPEAQLHSEALRLLARLIARKHIKSWQSKADADIRDGVSGDSNDK